MRIVWPSTGFLFSFLFLFLIVAQTEKSPPNRQSQSSLIEVCHAQIRQGYFLVLYSDGTFEKRSAALFDFLHQKGLTFDVVGNFSSSGVFGTALAFTAEIPTLSLLKTAPGIRFVNHDYAFDGTCFGHRKGEAGRAPAQLTSITTPMEPKFHGPKPWKKITARTGSLRDYSNTIQELTGVAHLHQLGYTGKGIRIAFIDSGFSPLRHTVYENRIYDQWNFVDDSKLPRWQYRFIDLDEGFRNTHGDQVVGIAVADVPHMRGVAYEARIAIYKIKRDSEVVSFSGIFAALERAYKFEAAVINLSIGQVSGWANGPAETVEALIQSSKNIGVIVVAAAGNSGTGGPGLVSSHAAADGSLGVGSASTSLIPGYRISAKSDTTSRLISYSFGHILDEKASAFVLPLFQTGSSSEIIDICGISASELDALKHTPSTALGNKLLLFAKMTKDDEPCRVAIFSAVANTNAIGMLLYGEMPTQPFPYFDRGLEGQKVPAMVGFLGSTDDVEWMLESVRAEKPVTVKFFGWDSTPVVAVKANSGQVMAIGVNIIAPGTNVFSVSGGDYGRYTTVSGSSFASPYVAGVAGLLLDAFKDYGLSKVQLGNLVRSKIGTMGVKLISSLNDEDVLQTGSGFLSTENALTPLYVEPHELNLGDTESFETYREIILHNIGNSDMQVNFQHGANPGRFELSRTKETESSTNLRARVDLESENLSFTIPGRGSKKLRLMFTAPTVEESRKKDLPRYSGVFEVTYNSKTELRIPYHGYACSIRNDVALFHHEPEITWGTNPLAAGYGIMRYICHSIKQSWPVLRIYAIWAMESLEIEYVARSTDTETFTIAKHGRRPRLADSEGGEGGKMLTAPALVKTLDGFFLDEPSNEPANLRPGQYFVRVRVLRVFGDASNPEHWETWESADITVGWQAD
ncbi:subtilisin-like protein [Ascobolus immersus RN42]|uniref:Subtilisin-like protein n=1 Tax=Ascobolus immersus RN42 TaxID=1160509 RepID=A0A3N4HZU9_ASCIM|nr:subtilisin-like protein [Ascobolus immersus RN42]